MGLASPFDADKESVSNRKQENMVLRLLLIQKITVSTS